MPTVIDRRSYTPVYRQLADILRAQIADGRLAPEAMLPGEDRLASEYGMSRDAVRDALAVLRHEGLVETLPSAGTRVRPVPVREEFSLQRGSRVILRMPTPQERAEHDIADGVPVAIVRHGARIILLVGDRVELVVK